MAYNELLGVGREPATLPVRINTSSSGFTIAGGAQNLTYSASAVSRGNILSALAVFSLRSIANPNGLLTIQAYWNDQLVSTNTIEPNNFNTNFAGAGVLLSETYNMLSGATCALGDRIRIDVIKVDGVGTCTYLADVSLSFVYQES